MEIVPRDYKVGPQYASAGEATYCQNGHLLGHFKKDVMTGDFPSGELEPVPGMSIGSVKCHVCGGAAMAGHGIYYFAVVN